MGSPIVFIILAVIALAAAIGMVRSQNAIHSAMFLILNFATVAVMYIILNAPFIAMVHVAVYAGAIMVLFLFVIMILGAEELSGVFGERKGNWQLPVSSALAALLLVAFGFMMFGDKATQFGEMTQVPADFSAPSNVGLELFANYVLPFEITSVLLLVAIIGVVVLRTKRKGGNNA